MPTWTWHYFSGPRTTKHITRSPVVALHWSKWMNPLKHSLPSAPSLDQSHGSVFEVTYSFLWNVSTFWFWSILWSKFQTFRCWSLAVKKGEGEPLESQKTQEAWDTIPDTNKATPVTSLGLSFLLWTSRGPLCSLDRHLSSKCPQHKYSIAWCAPSTGHQDCVLLRSLPPRWLQVFSAQHLPWAMNQRCGFRPALGMGHEKSSLGFTICHFWLQILALVPLTNFVTWDKYM